MLFIGDAAIFRFLKINLLGFCATMRKKYLGLARTML